MPSPGQCGSVGCSILQHTKMLQVQLQVRVHIQVAGLIIGRHQSMYVSHISMCLCLLLPSSPYKINLKQNFQDSYV